MKMKIKYIRETSGPTEILILEINDRVNELLYKDDLSDTDKAILKADLKSLDNIRTNTHVGLMARNLIEKIDYLLGESE